MNVHIEPVLAWTPGPWELIILLFVVLLLFGSRKLPDLARSLGQSLTEFKKGKEQGMKELRDAKKELEQVEKETTDERTD